ncbi:hypothetical protein [Granulosicoccus antarcticus]|uniref:Uncharacterized protein n=1 Tax=Granulosicoccus antarcticus IMCC3135 TaxID=1192854 RepID=A0A2Z2NY25_9GAMM|nr:hypothetical protein [Granulosicoccus antarcticus]ASJ73740.1 hypothetical protein IMCC3135_18305 [Granulosicoccus antarcticus IMCC3135]
MMSFRILAATIGLAGVLSACDNTTIGSFTVDEDLPETRVEGGGFVTILPAELAPFNLNIEASEEFGAEQYDYLTYIKLSSLSFSITASSEDADEDVAENGMPDDFDFLSSIALYIEASIDGTEQRALIASLAQNDTQLSSGMQNIQLSTTGVDILDFVEADDGYTIVSEVSGTAPPDAVIFDGSSSYRVGVGFR